MRDVYVFSVYTSFFLIKPSFKDSPCWQISRSMARTTNTKIHSVILLTGISIACLGILLTTAGFMIKEELRHSFVDLKNDYDMPRDSQFWAGIPVCIFNMDNLLPRYTYIYFLCAKPNATQQFIRILKTILCS